MCLQARQVRLAQSWSQSEVVSYQVVGEVGEVSAHGKEDGRRASAESWRMEKEKGRCEKGNSPG